MKKKKYNKKDTAMFKARVWKTGNSHVISVPLWIVQHYELKKYKSKKNKEVIIKMEFI